MENNNYPDEIARKWKHERDDLLEIYHTAQGILTALNVGNVQSESLLHKDLRKKLIDYRAKHDPDQQT